MFRQIAKSSFFWFGVVSTACAEDFVSLTEKEFLADVPVVLSVSRLPQRLDETPGAVTVIDRQMIRMSGARDVADLLRLVPGFRVSNSFEDNAPQAGYHTVGVEDFVNHLQVLVDGRSVYSAYHLGSTSVGLQTVALADIERIEVLRGTGGAAYGARAFLGTINIVTRHSVDTVGSQAQVVAGDNGVRDGLVRLGWGGDAASYRLTVDQRFDDGLIGAGGSDRVRRANFRADIRPSAHDTLELRLGQTMSKVGVGFAPRDGNAIRERSLSTSHLQLDWKRSLSMHEDVAVQFSRTTESSQDAFDYQPVPGVVVDFSGRAMADSLLLQHSSRQGDRLRLVVGGEFRREEVASMPVFDTGDAFVTNFLRVFGNAEWRLHPSLLLNAGGMFERSTLAGEQMSPRLMLNWHMTPQQTLRMGIAHGLRTPSTFEKHANTRYYLDGVLLNSTFVAQGQVAPAKVVAREIGYLADFPALETSLDLRLFREEIQGYILDTKYPYPVASDGFPGFADGFAIDFVNKEDFRLQGAEYQLRWRPWGDGRVIWNHSFVQSSQTVGSGDPSPVLRSYGLMFMQTMRNGVSMSLQHYRTGSMYLPGETYWRPPVSRTDIRMAWPVRLGQARGEVALVVQNLGDAYQDYVTDHLFQRRVFVQLNLGG